MGTEQYGICSVRPGHTGRPPAALTTVSPRRRARPLGSVAGGSVVRVCVVGSGGREHALAHVLARTADVIVTPGNPGIPGSAAVPPEEVDADLFVVGPEAPLVDGLADRLRGAGQLVFGPGADGARLEGSKAWMKDLLAAAAVPTAALRQLRRRGRSARLPADAAGPLGGQDRWVGGGQGRPRDRATRRGGGRRAGEALRRVVRRCRAHGRDRGGLDRPRAVGPGHLRRHPGGAPGAGSGLQAGGGRRHRSQHRRHGRLLAGARRRRRRRRHGDGPVRGAHAGRAAPAWHRLPGRALRGAHAHAGGTQAAGVQRALRRSRGPGRAAPAHERPGRAARGRGRGRPAPVACARLRPRCLRHGRCWRRRAIPASPDAAT